MAVDPVGEGEGEVTVAALQGVLKVEEVVEVREWLREGVPLVQVCHLWLLMEIL